VVNINHTATKFKPNQSEMLHKSKHRHMGWGGGAVPPKFWASQLFGGNKKHLGKGFLKHFYFFREITMQLKN